MSLCYVVVPGRIVSWCYVVVSGRIASLIYICSIVVLRRILLYFCYDN